MKLRYIISIFVLNIVAPVLVSANGLSFIDNSPAFQDYFFLGIANDHFSSDRKDLNSTGCINSIKKVLKSTINPSVIDTLTNRDSIGILKGIDDFREIVKSNNNNKLVIIYISSHGEVNDSTYYLACKGENAIAANALMEQIVSIANIDRTTVLLCMDTCHSGALISNIRNKHSKLLIITSCNDNQKTVQLKPNGETYMSQGFCKAFTSHKGFEEGYIDFNTIISSIRGNNPPSYDPTVSASGKFAFESIIYKYDVKRDFIPWTESKDKNSADILCWSIEACSTAVLTTALTVELCNRIKINEARNIGDDTLRNRNTGKICADISRWSLYSLAISYIGHTIMLMTEDLNKSNKQTASVYVTPYCVPTGAGITLALNF